MATFTFLLLIITIIQEDYMSKITQFPSAETGAQNATATEQRVQRETVIEYLRAFGFDRTLSEAERSQFTQTALACDLNPFKREIHIAVYGEGANRKVSIITGYQTYLKRAERTGNLDGWGARLEGEGSNMKAVVEIFRKDWSHSFTHEVYWEEAVQKKKDGSPTQFWAKQPRFQLRKVATAQAFRLAFPDELGSLPYETAELPDGDAAQESSTVANTVTTSTESLAEEALRDARPPATSTQPGANTSQESDVKMPNDERTRLINRIETLFDKHPGDFTRKHMDWILNNANRAVDKAGVSKMVAYTEKVIRAAKSA
jgi:phage recombination protein Bet